jgi:hypothetical protein
VARLIVPHLLADGGPITVTFDGTFFSRWRKNVAQARWAYDGAAAQGGKKIAFGNTWVTPAILIQSCGHFLAGEPHSDCDGIQSELAEHGGYVSVPAVCSLAHRLVERYEC